MSTVSLLNNPRHIQGSEQKQECIDYSQVYATSKFDANIKVSMSKWAVTMTTEMGRMLMAIASREFQFRNLIATNEQRLKLIQRHVRKIDKIPNSCYTWAEEKLKIIQVEMPQGFLDRFISVSTFYVTRRCGEREKTLAFLG